ncbi:MAG: ABC transporter permease [Deltaproteobacteria bacterium]|nr:ABC transporter permease [Deltaproteobacteria bacterium]
MKDVAFLAWRYLVYHRAKTATLVGSIALILFLPAGLNVLVDQSAEELTTRADKTPLLIGAKGSPLELVLSSLYFESRTPASIKFSDADRISDSGFAEAIPLYVRFRSRDYPIVGTNLEYFDFRGLQIASGRMMAALGECVIGAEAARDLEVGPGDFVTSSPEGVFDLGGVYPLRMSVAGVLAPSHSPDDRAVFADLKTTWIIEGFGHGHQDLASPEAASSVLSRKGDRITANAAVVQYNEITPENIDRFHFHGDLSSYPLSSVIAIPNSEKTRALLLGRYQDDGESQLVDPRLVMDELLETVLTVREYAIAAVAIAAFATLLTTALVFLLSIRLRRRELDTMMKIGASRQTIVSVLVSEVAAVLLFAGILAGGLVLAISRFGSAAIRALLLS